ncbi:hypothetical protein ACH5RR_015464 [Cinchona calisaya]|uniref:FCP1 homology domain-containing protein n=1 Tax=Cinchona calisaya TaxID=153742 RepID=A0ABD2ZWP5_9GENT
MPSLKMKTKSTIGCLKEKNGLRICPKSTIISKNSLCISKISQSAEELETIIHHTQDVCSCDQMSAHDSIVNEADHDESFNGEKLLLQKQYTPLIDLTAVSRMESSPSTCMSSEMIFSPILESVDIHNESYIDYFGGNDLYVPQLEAEDSDDSSKGSCEYHTCCISDFFMSDMIFSGLPVDGNLVFDDNTDTKFLPGFACEEPNTSSDLAEEAMAMPYLKSAVENGFVHDNRTCEDTIADSSDSSLYLAIHQLRSCNQESDLNISDADQPESFDPHMFIRNLPDLPDLASDLRPTILSKDSKKPKSVTLVLDLDETLVHSTLEHSDDADFSFPVFFNMQEHTVYVKQRPHLLTFLERVSEMFEIVVFTASQSIYAKQLLDILDPDGKLISRRAYRESCIFSDGSYTKDLTVLGVDLAKVVIIDNSPQVFRLQVNNGIPIESWFDDRSDSALISLLPFLETLVDTDDVRPVIAKRFGNKE